MLPTLLNEDASTSTITTQSLSSNDRGRRTGGRFGPRRSNGLVTSMSDFVVPALRHVQNITTIRSTHRYGSIHSVEISKLSSPAGTAACCKLDSHANTCVAGPNFQLDEYSGKFCEVTPYSDYQPQTNIPIVNALTAYTNDAPGETVLLRFNQVLWYGSRLNMRFINPYQIRHFVITVLDDPTDKTRPFGITGVDFYIPFQIQVTTVYFETRVPTPWEHEHCRIVELTCDTPWNPGEVNISASCGTSLQTQNLF